MSNACTLSNLNGCKIYRKETLIAPRKTSLQPRFRDVTIGAVHQWEVLKCPDAENTRVLAESG